MTSVKFRLRTLERKMTQSGLDDRASQERQRALFDKINAVLVRAGRHPPLAPRRFLPGIADNILAAILQGDRSAIGRRGCEYIEEMLEADSAMVKQNAGQDCGKPDLAGN